MEVDAEKLIVLIEARPPLYNYQLKDHHNRDLIESLWKEISEDMKASGKKNINKLDYLLNILILKYRATA